MMRYGHHAPSTPELLLDDTVTFVAQLVNDMKTAACLPSAHYKNMSELRIECSDNTQDRANHPGILKREPYACQHPATIDALFRAVEKMMNIAGLKHASHEDYVEKDGKLNKGEFYMQCEGTSTRLHSFSIIAHATSGKIKTALSVRDAGIHYLTQESLEELFKEKSTHAAEPAAQKNKQTLKP